MVVAGGSGRGRGHGRSRRSVADGSLCDTKVSAKVPAALLIAALEEK